MGEAKKHEPQVISMKNLEQDVQKMAHKKTPQLKDVGIDDLRKQLKEDVCPGDQFIAPSEYFIKAGTK